MRNIHNPHDLYFRNSMSNPRVAKEISLQHLPSYIWELLDSNSFKLKSSNFVDEKLKESRTDILYSVNFSGEKAYLYFLFEHQSKPEKFMPFRLMHYLFHIMQQHLKEGHKELPVIIPLVFYNGKKPWSHSTDFFTLFGKQEKLARAAFFQPFHLIELSKIPDEQLKQSLYAGVIQLAQKHIYSSDATQSFYQLSPLLKQLEKENEKGYIESTITYLFQNANFRKNFNTLARMMEKNQTTSSGDEMTLAQYFENKGKRKGKREGIKEGIKKGVKEGLSKGKSEGIKMTAINLLREGLLEITSIAKVTGLSVKEIESLR